MWSYVLSTYITVPSGLLVAISGYSMLYCKLNTGYEIYCDGLQSVEHAYCLSTEVSRYLCRTYHWVISNESFVVGLGLMLTNSCPQDILGISLDLLNLHQQTVQPVHRIFQELHALCHTILPLKGTAVRLCYTSNQSHKTLMSCSRQKAVFWLHHLPS